MKKKRKRKRKKKWISFDTLPFLTALDSWKVETSEKRKEERKGTKWTRRIPNFLRWSKSPHIFCLVHPCFFSLSPQPDCLEQTYFFHVTLYYSEDLIVITPL